MSSIVLVILRMFRIDLRRFTNALALPIACDYFDVCKIKKGLPDTRRVRQNVHSRTMLSQFAELRSHENAPEIQQVPLSVVLRALLLVPGLRSGRREFRSFLLE